MSMETDTEDVTYQWQILDEGQENALSRHYSEFVSARDQRDGTHYEFDGMSLIEKVEFNAKTACSYIEPRKNASDINIVTGIPREKMLAIASNILKLNLRPEALATDQNDDQDAELSRAFTNLLRKSNELDGDEEKQLMRVMYLLEQGTCLVEEAWVPRSKKRKIPKDRTKMDPANGFKDLEWYTREIQYYHAESRILDLSQVYFGNIKQYDINLQPFLFTRVVMHVKEAEAIYGNWSEWKYVHAGNRSLFGEDGSDSIPYRDFRLYELESEQVEVVVYQNVWEDEYQIYINGVAMLPYGFAIPWN